LPIVLLTQYLETGAIPLGSVDRVILTGPQIVTAETAADVIDAAAAGLREHWGVGGAATLPPLEPNEEGLWQPSLPRLNHRPPMIGYVMSDSWAGSWFGPRSARSSL